MAFWNKGRRKSVPVVSPGSNLYPGPGQWGSIDLPNPSSTVVKGLPAANRALQLISNAVAQMAPMELWTPDGYEMEGAKPNILVRPNATFTTFDFYQMVVEEAIVHGNFVGVLADFDRDGYPQQVVPVPHGFFLAYYDGAGYLVYSIGGEIYSAEEVVHIRTGATANQPMGRGVVAQFRRAIGQALDQQSMVADTYRSGSVPSGIIELDLPEVDQAQAEATVSQWLTNHAEGQAPAVLPNTMKFTPISWSPEDMQFLQAREFTIGEIAHMFNLDPTDLGTALGGSMTYANIEQRQQARITDTYAPWMLRIEQAWSDLIPGGNVAKLCPHNLLRTDAKTSAEVDQINIASGVTSPEEARKRSGKKPLPKEKPKPVAPVIAPVMPMESPDEADPNESEAA